MRDLARASVMMKGMVVIPTRTVMRGLTTPLAVGRRCGCLTP
jgi:hypothetical protein